MPYITIITSGICGLVFVALSLNVILFRKNNRIAYGNGNNDILNRKIRAHGNFAEYVPFCLFSLLITEITSTPLFVTIILAALLVIARLIHAYGVLVSESNKKFLPRMIGMILTLSVLMITSVINIYMAVSNLTF